jgi:hypothetical protein
VHIATAVTVVGLASLVLIIVLPAPWLRSVGWIVPVYLIVAVVATLCALVAALSKDSDSLTRRIVILAAINIVGALGVGYVFLTFRIVPATNQGGMTSNNTFERTGKHRRPRLAAARASWPAAQLGR